MAGFPETEVLLRFNFPDYEDDLRKVSIWMEDPRPNPPEPLLKLYYFSSFERLSTYYRFNLITGRYENAGNIEWNNRYSVILNLGLRTKNMNDMTYKNNNSSRSRRFVALDNKEYKWRPVENEPANLECLTVSGRKFVAFWNATEQTLRVHPRGFGVLDDIVVLCLVHLWRRANNFDFQVPETSAEGTSAA